MTNLAAAFLFGGFLLTFGAVGGMDAVPVWEPNPYFWHQVVMAFTGLFFMFIGVIIMPEERDYE